MPYSDTSRPRGPTAQPWNPWTGWHYLAITNTRDLVYLEPAAGVIVISPSKPDQFVAQLRARLAPARAWLERRTPYIFFQSPAPSNAAAAR